MHRRLRGMTAKDLPYRGETFRYACKKLFQHRSLALAMVRASIATFSSRMVTWNRDDASLGRSIGTHTTAFDHILFD